MAAAVALILALTVAAIVSSRSRRTAATPHAVRVAASRRPHREIR